MEAEPEQTSVEVESNNTPKLSKTQESIASKGDKSYYYWHNSIPKTVKIDSPPLVKREETPLEIVKEFRKITNYAWTDESDKIKVYVDLAKVGSQTEVVPDLPTENISLEFGATSFDLKLINFKGADFQLKISNLNKEVVPNECSYRCKSKVIITLKKKDDKEKWWDLTSKK